MRPVTAVHDAAPPHWAGDGFPVRSIFSYDGLGREMLSPFLLLDYAGNVGCIGPGDGQWMTAAAGVVQEDFHSARFTREGEIAQAIRDFRTGRRGTPSPAQPAQAGGSRPR